MSAGRRAPGFFTLSAFVLLIGSVGLSIWWWNRPAPERAKALDPSKLDVYCSGRVDVSGMVISLEPTQPSRVEEVHVTEGATVQADQKLISFDDSLAKSRLSQAEAAVEAVEVELSQIQNAKARFPMQLAARQLLLNAAASRVEAAKKYLQQRQQQQSLNPLGKFESEAMEAQVHELEQLEAAERGQFEDTKKTDAEFDLRLRGSAARRKAALADLALAQKAVKDCVLLAPAAGTILRLQATKGGLVAPGTPVPPIVFAPAGPMVVRAEVDQEALGRVKVGMKVEVQDENRLDGPMWTGKVQAVSGWVAMRRTLVLEPGEISDVRTVECLVELAPSREQLWIGQRMRVRILRGE
jgi:multidrug resistance efflux pump